MKQVLMDKINKREILVGVVGLGYVGLPLAVEKSKAGFKTIGFDVQKNKVDMVNRCENYINDISDEDLTETVKSGMFKATSDFSFIKNMDFIAICVPTPLDTHQQPDLRFIKSSAKDIAKYIKKGTMVVLESTTYPGTTEELLKPLLEEGSGLVCGEDFYVGFSPERVDPGNRIYNIKNTPKVVGAIGSDAVEVISHMYRTVLDGDIHTVSSPAVAEMEKILENTYRNINIGMINELAILCNKMGISIWEVIDAAKTKPYGFQAFYPGSGLGGHCIPLDPYYLSWKAREYNFHTSMIEASMIINDRMPEYCVERISKLLNCCNKALKGTSILLLGVAFKQDVADDRNSPAISVLNELENNGALVDFYDPYIKEINKNKHKKESIACISPVVIQQYDIVVITTAHSNVDYKMVSENAKLIFDTKNVLKNIKTKDNIEVL